MPNTIKVRRGPSSGLPTLNAGEFGFCTDTQVLYIGTAGGNVQVFAPSAMQQYLLAENHNQQSTTSTSYVDALTLDVSAGSWILWATAQLANSSNTYSTGVRLYNKTDAAEIITAMSPDIVASNYYEWSWMAIRSQTYSATKTVAIQFNTSNSSGTAYVRHCVILAIRTG